MISHMVDELRCALMICARDSACWPMWETPREKAKIVKNKELTFMSAINLSLILFESWFNMKSPA